MSEQLENKILLETYEQKRAAVANFNLMDDTFFSVVMSNNAACEYLLTKLLGMPLKVIENKTQYSIRNIENRSITLDVLAEDENGRLFNVEIQGANEYNHEYRIRYYRTALDWSCLQKGADYSKLPELYMIFISEFDPLKLNRVHYEIVQSVKGSGEPYSDGVHIHYFNTKIDDGSELAKLMQYLKKSDAGNTDFGALSQAVSYHKASNEGVEHMCRIMEDYGEQKKNEGRIEGKIEGRIEGRIEGKIEGKIETIKNLLKNDISLDIALKCAELDRQTYERYADLQ